MHMTEDGAFLVAGGDSLVGGALFEALKRRGRRALASTRRADSRGSDRVYLNFEEPESFRAPSGVSYTYIVAAATNYDRCEKDPLAHRINVELIPHLVASLLEQGLFVTFISTNSVFGGERPWPGEDDKPAPGIAYARQKSEGERRIVATADRLAARDRLNVVRLTKILSPEVPPLPAWFSAWKKGVAVQPFADLIFAPISTRFVGKALAELGEKRIPGNLHLSGADNVNYVELARAFCRAMGVDHSLVVPTTADEKGVNIPFKPRYSGLRMTRTTKLSGIQPQTLASLVDDLIADMRQDEEQ